MPICTIGFTLTDRIVTIYLFFPMSDTYSSVSVNHSHTCQVHMCTQTSRILSPTLREPLCAAGLSGLMCLMKTPLIISPLLSLRPIPLPPMMLIPRDWPGARVSRTLKHRARGVFKHCAADDPSQSSGGKCVLSASLHKYTYISVSLVDVFFKFPFHCLTLQFQCLRLNQNNKISSVREQHKSFFLCTWHISGLSQWDGGTNAINTSWESSHVL